MRIASIEGYEAVNGPLGGVSVATQGCPHHCYKCFNPETWDFKGGEEYTDVHRNQIIQYLRRPGIARLTFLGGEPLMENNIPYLLDLVEYVKYDPELRTKIEWITIFTGYTLELVDLKKDDPLGQLLSMCDLVIDGRFDYTRVRKGSEIVFRGSDNQRLICPIMSLAENKIVEYADEYFLGRCKGKYKM